MQPKEAGAGRWEFEDLRGLPSVCWLLLILPGTFAHWLAWATFGFTGNPEREVLLLVISGIFAAGPAVLWWMRGRVVRPAIVDTQTRTLEVHEPSGRVRRYRDAHITPCDLIFAWHFRADRYSAVVLSAEDYCLLLHVSTTPDPRAEYFASLPSDLQQLSSLGVSRIVVVDDKRVLRSRRLRPFLDAPRGA